MRAINQLLRESSRVSNRRVPHMCVAELTSQVVCRPTTTRRNTPQSTNETPPSANSKKILERQRHLIRPVSVQPMIAHADAETRTHPEEEQGDGQCLPTEHE